MPPQTTTLFSVSILFLKINGNNIHSNEQNLLRWYKTDTDIQMGERNIMYTNKVDGINTYYNTTTILHTGRSHIMLSLLTMFVPQKSFGIYMIYSYL